MTLHKLSVDIDKKNHKIIKLFCLQNEINIRDFVVNTVLEKINMLENKQCKFDEKNAEHKDVIRNKSGKI